MELDKKSIAGVLGIDEDMLNELLQDFIAQTEGSLKKLDGAIDADNFDEIGKVAHFIKGASGNLRINQMYETARSMEIHATKECKDKRAIMENAKALKVDLEELRKFVQ